MLTGWKPLASNENQVARMKQLACSPVSMGTDVGSAIHNCTLQTKGRQSEPVSTVGKVMCTTNDPLGSIQAGMHDPEQGSVGQMN